MNYQIISDIKGKAKAVIVGLKDFKKIQEDLEELELIKEYESAKRERLTFRPLDDVLREVSAKRAKKK